MMLAYVFWHWTAQRASPYRDRLAAFHRALAGDPPRGFQPSFSFSIGGAARIPRGTAFDARVSCRPV
jgi:hypothetical protein